MPVTEENANMLHFILMLLKQYFCWLCNIASLFY